MNAPESVAPMHLEAQGKAERPCDTCGGLFKPKRAWARFCSSKCRNDFHGKVARLAAIVEAAPKMYEALRQISEGWAQGGDAALIAAAAIKDLKSPEDPPKP